MSVLASMASSVGRPRNVPYAFGAMHAVVDASTVTVVVSSSFLHTLSLGQAFSLILAYDLIAFGAQTFLGALVDRVARPRTTVLVGLALTASCVGVLPYEPTAAMILAGAGNALFHVGAGALTLCMSGGRAAPAGIFVGPGALGLAFGTWLGRQGVYLPWPFYAALALCFAATLLFREPARYGVVPDAQVSPAGQSPSRVAVRLGVVIVALLLFSIVVRSLVGFAGTHDCPRGPITLVALGLAAFSGKALGGVISDRLGWAEVSVGALLCSAPLIAFGGTHVMVVAAGMFLFQMTMPVTLSAVALVMPNRPALAFGLTCLALVTGSLPTFTNVAVPYYRPEVFLALIALSAFAIWISLRVLGPAWPLRGLLRRAAGQPRAS